MSLVTKFVNNDLTHRTINNHRESLDVHQINDEFNLDHSKLVEGENNFGGFTFRGGLRHSDIH